MNWPQVPQLLHAEKFLEMTKRYGSRVIHQEVDPCPNGHMGCDVCKRRGSFVGYHARTTPAEAFAVDLLRDPSPEGSARELIPHLHRAGPIRAEGYVSGELYEFTEGEDFTVAGREIRWINAPDRQTLYRLLYDAVPEHDVHLIHVAGDFAGVRRKAETLTFSRMGALAQGQIGMDVPAGALQALKVGDRITPVDGTMRYTETILARGVNFSRHQFVKQVVRAFAVPYGESEEEVAVTFDPVTRRFTATVPDDMPSETQVTVVYDACPTYQVWLDQGEYRTVLGEPQPRLVVLSLLETAQGQR